MTVSTEISRSGPYAANGAQVNFDFDFDIETESDLRVIHTSALGVETVLTLTTDYTVSASPWTTGGTITTVATYPTGEFVTILRSLPYKQATDLAKGGLLPADTIEQMIDRVTKLVQQVREITLRSLLLPESSTVSGITMPDPDPGKLLVWDDATNSLVNISIADLDLSGSGVTITAFGESLIEAGNAAAARALLLDAGLGDINVFTKTQKWAKGADIASAAVLAVGVGDGNYFDVTGTTAVTSIATIGVGSVIRVHFDGVLTLTHHATDLVLPGGADILTAADDEATFVEYATGDWRCVNYSKADGTAVQNLASVRDISRDLVIDRPTTTTIDIDASEIVLQTSNGNARRVDSVNLVVDLNGSGANGLDTGSKVANTWYYLWVIYNPTTSTTAGLISLSKTAPTLPSGYTFKALVGAARTNGSTLFYDFKQTANRVYLNEARTVLSSGAGVSVWTSLAITDFFPSTARLVTMWVESADATGLAPESTGRGASLINANGGTTTSFNSLLGSDLNHHTHSCRYRDVIYRFNNLTADFFAMGWEYQ